MPLEGTRLGGRKAPRPQKYVLIDEQVETLIADNVAKRIILIHHYHVTHFICLLSIYICKYLYKYICKYW